MLLLCSACARIQFPEPLKITNVSSFVYIKDDQTYNFNNEDIVLIVTYFNQSEPTTYQKIVESVEYFKLESNDEWIILTLFKEKDDYFIQISDDTYRLSHNFYTTLQELIK